MNEQLGAEQHRVVDADQTRAIRHDGGPLLVLGSPGTGKTTVLVERWVRLGTHTTQPHRVLLLVPTRDRALALRDELPWRLPQQAIVEVPVHTWHAFAYHLVTRYYGKLGYSQPPVRLTTAEQWSVVRDLLAGEDPNRWGAYGDHLSSDAFTSEVADFCVRAGHRGLSDGELAELADRRPEHAPVASFAVRYREHLRATAALDYAELVLAATRLLAQDEDIAAAVQRRFTHVLVDDAQELAPAQLRLLQRLNTDHLVCAGDPDSAIEAFRGADPTWLRRFEELAPTHERIVLPACYRFGPHIGEITSSLISHAPDGQTHRASTYEGHDDAADLRCFATMAGELDAAAREMRTAHLLDDIPYDRMAILLAQPSTYGHSLERVLDSFGVPYRIASADRPLGSEPAVRAVLDVCRLALGPEPTDDLCKAVLSSPIVGMHPYRLRDLAREAFLRKTSLLEVATDADGDDAKEFRSLIDAAAAAHDEPADATFSRLFEISSWCSELIERRREVEAAHHLDALRALSEALAHFVERRPGGTMRAYLATSADAGFAADTWTPKERSEGVHILSFHRSKGLEWDVVWLLGVAEGQMPKAHRAQGLFDPWALEEGGAVDRALAQLAEERRTLYVALSRARRRLVVSCSPGVRQATPSRFCEEAFGAVPDPLPAAGPNDSDPLTLAEAAARHRRTLAQSDRSDDEKSAAAAALARIDGLDPSGWWWRRDWTSGAPLTPEGKLTTSYSRISRYDECPLRYVLESVLGLDPQSTYQMKFGSLVHRIMERADPASGDLKTWEEALDTYKREFVSHHRTDYPNDVFARTYYRYGVQSLKRWWRTERNAGETVAVEYAFDDLDFHGHTIRGRIDRIAKGPRGLVLSDYKTSRNAIGWEEAQESLQLAIYYRAAQTHDDLREHGEPHLMQLIYPGIEHTDRNDGSLHCAKRIQTPEEAETALGRLDAILEQAANEEFSPSPEADCRWCRMRQLCPRWPEGKEVPR